MPATHENDPRFAILIDADNVSEKYVKIIIDEVANLGIATYKRIYGDWTSSRLASWKSCLLEHSIIPMQQYSYTYGKNATDSAMIIDAMDILYSGNVDGFAIVSSDSDFTRLASRLRESGMQVIGMGEQKTPEPFIAACNQFKYLDLLYAARKAEETDDDASDEGEEASRAKRRKKAGRKQRAAQRQRTGEDEPVDPEEDEGAPAPGEEASAPARPHRRPGDAGGARSDAVESDEATASIDFAEMSRAARRNHMKRIRSTINAIIDKFSDDEGWVSLGRLGDELSKRLSDFDVRNYGFKKLRPFLKSLGVYEFDEPDGTSGQRQIYLRIREQDHES